MATIDVLMTKDDTELVKQASEEAIERALVAIGLAAEGRAKMKCPVDTSRLINSITNSIKDRTVYIGTNVEYAVYVEMGTVNTPPQPYLRPAIANHIDNYRNIALVQLRKS